MLNKKPRGTVVHDKKYQLFIQWLSENNFPKSKLTLANFTNTGRGMMATEDIEAGEVIVSVPKKFILTYENVSKLYGSTHSLSTHQLLALHLVLLRKDRQSWWTPYIDLLPIHFDTMPVNYPDLLIGHLPTSLKKEVLQQKENIKHDFLVCFDFLKSNAKKLGIVDSIQSDEFEWAWLCVNTRCIHISKMGSMSTSDKTALAPMLDFLNHTTEAKIESGFNSQNQSFEIKTLTPYQKGDQVYINYGPHDNMAMLREYGFVLSKNSYNFVSLDKEVWDLFSETESSRGLQIKKKILEKSGYAEDYTINGKEISFRLITALRLLALSGTTEPGFDRRLMDWHDVMMGQTEVISQENERKVFLMLKSLIQRIAVTINKELVFLSNISEAYPEVEVHPFSVYFVRQIWTESDDIINQTLEYISEKLLEFQA